MNTPPQKTTPGRLRKVATGVGLALGALLCGVIGLDRLFWLTGLDQRMVRRALYFQYTEVEVFQHEEDPFLVYGLRPDSRVVGERDDYAVNISRHGTRGPAWEEEKPDGHYRILFLGASTLYGAGVNDDETMAATLERELENRRVEAGEDHPVRRYEVWNYGTSAYRMSQMARVGRRELARREPDLLLLLFTNTGRRPFLGGDRTLPSYWRFFEGDPFLLEENFPPPEGVSRTLHRRGMFTSALYRYARAHIRRFGDEDKSPYADRVSIREAELLQEDARAAGVPLLFMFVPGQDWDGRAPATWFPAGTPQQDFIDLYQPDREDEYYEVHPPEWVLAEWGDTIARELVERGHTPGLPATPRNRAPEVQGTSHGDATTIELEGRDGTLDWFVSDEGEGPLAYTLYSDLDGVLWEGEGSAGAVQVPLAVLPRERVHVLSLEAVDEVGAAGRASLSLRLGPS